MAAGLLGAGGGWEAHGQATTDLLTTNLPYPAYEPVGDNNYLIRYGRLGMRLDASAHLTFTDNGRITSGPKQAEWSFGPLLTAGFFLPVSKYQKLQLDLGIGYDYYTGRDSRFRLNVVPNSHLDYGFRIGEVNIRFFDKSSTTSDSSSQIQVSGGSGAGVEFRQLDNRAGVSASWGASPRVSVYGGYTFTLTRTLTDSFTQLDRDTHGFNLGTQWQVAYPLKVGLAASYSMFQYAQRIQNNGQSKSVGPTFEWKPADAWTIEGGVSMTQTTFDQTGTIQDTSDFLAPTFDLSVNYVMNRSMHHTVNLSRTVDTGYGSNFTDVLSAGYRFGYKLGPKIEPNFRFTYSDTLSGGAQGDSASLYIASIGAGYPLARKLRAGLNYSYAVRVSESVDRGYSENRVMLDFSYRF